MWRKVYSIICIKGSIRFPPSVNLRIYNILKQSTLYTAHTYARNYTRMYKSIFFYIKCLNRLSDRAASVLFQRCRRKYAQIRSYSITSSMCCNLKRFCLSQKCCAIRNFYSIFLWSVSKTETAEARARRLALLVRIRNHPWHSNG